MSTLLSSEADAWRLGAWHQREQGRTFQEGMEKAIFYLGDLAKAERYTIDGDKVWNMAESRFAQLLGTHDKFER
ncbi:hypothetical protein CEXT_484171 [Caerostris extrusa]|uniref:Uncharacterized protein n=1 Tax=Caerostris extrusa TaxID=172846 RepID=A0AAV4NT73_CAEEX|nr:hypothetical protein CEXT_484171 [Caerostris extrusa]